MKCAFCGKEFTPRAKTHRFCCRRCALNMNYRENPERRRKNREYSAARRPAKPPATKICVICGKEFETTYPFKKCCSDKCSLKNKRLRSKDYFHKHLSAKPEPKPEPKLEAEKEICQNCGKEFKPSKDASQFCCRACYDEYRKPKSKSKPKIKPQSQLNDLVKQAAECNLDYGTYRGLIAQGKTFEELKAQASLRNPQTHQHTPHRER